MKHANAAVVGGKVVENPRAYRYSIKFYTLVTHMNLPDLRVITRKSGRFIALSTELTKLCRQKIVLTIPDSANTISEEKNAKNIFCHLSCTLVKQFLKFGTALLIGPAKNCLSAIFNSEIVLGVG